MDHLISARRAYIIIINNNKRRENLQNRGFDVQADHKIKSKESEKKDKHLDLAGKLKRKKAIERVGDSYGHRDWCFWYSN